MARSNCNPDVEAPRGMMKFEVIRTTIRDSLGQFCEVGDMATLDKKVAKAYLDKNLIKVALPDFDEGDDDGEADAGDPDDGDGTDTAERTKAAPVTRAGARKRG